MSNFNKTSLRQDADPAEVQALSQFALRVLRNFDLSEAQALEFLKKHTCNLVFSLEEAVEDCYLWEVEGRL